MTTQLDLDLTEGLARKADGIASVEAQHPTFVQTVRAHLRALAETRYVSADDAREIAARLGLDAPHKNCWGAIFSGRGWRRVGERPSAVVTNHAHVNPLWMWVGK